MPALGKIEITVQSATGTALSGVSVEIRKQGAQVFGAQSGSPITVDSPGAIIAGDTIRKNTETSPTRGVSAITATTITCAPGFASLSDDDRLTVVTPLPTVYEDETGATSTSNPLTTDSNGYAQCYIVGGKYDVLLSGGGITTTRLIQDMVSTGGESTRSNVYMSGTATAWKRDTLRTAAAGDKLFDLQNAGVSKFSVAGDGEIVAGAAGATHTLTGTLTTSGALTVQAGGVAVTGAVTGTTTITAGTGVTATTGNVAASAGNVTAKRVVLAGTATAHVAGDWVLSAGWGASASISQILSNDQRGYLQISSAGAGQLANPTCTLTFKDGLYSGGFAPQFVICRGEGGNQLTVPVASQSASTSAWGFTFLGTPVAGEFYQFHYVAIG